MHTPHTLLFIPQSIAFCLSIPFPQQMPTDVRLIIGIHIHAHTQCSLCPTQLYTLRSKVVQKHQPLPRLLFLSREKYTRVLKDEVALKQEICLSLLLLLRNPKGQKEQCSSWRQNRPPPRGHAQSQQSYSMFPPQVSRKPLPSQQR